MDYPKHLSEKNREEVAISYLKHELRKIFPSIETKEVENLINNKELCQPRDFWNGLHGISMGFKLKNILYLITAENIAWQKKTIRVNELSFGVEMKILSLNEIIKIRGNDFERENDPIIAIETTGDGKKIIKVHDGNGRLARHIAENKEEIEVYLGKMDGIYPQNYWLSTSLLIDNLYFVYEAIRNKDENLFKSQMEVINNMLRNSESGKIEFRERALTSKKEIREKILKELNF